MRHPPPARHALLGLVLAATAAAAAWRIGDGYIARLPDHHGFRLVAVDDAVDPVAAREVVRPRHTVVIVVDGLRRDAAESLAAVARLRAAGQCRVTDVGHLSVSRPVYAVISTGLEADRTGSRNNDETGPLAAESIWQVAHEAGLAVVGVSELKWWRQLFPDAFTRYETPPRAADYFALAAPLLGDVTLIHPVYVDEVGHAHGAASAEYAAAVTRLDGELGPFLDRLDLAQDLVVLTADHGHSARGGHGGVTPEIARVLTCFAGHGVTRRPDDGTLDTRTIAPTLAVLLGLRFPRTMRAGDDQLDTIFDIADGALLSTAWRADRQAALSRFRAANDAQLRRWGVGSWSQLYSRERAWQLGRLGGALALIAAGVALAVRRRGLGWRSALASVGWMAGVVVATAVTHAVVRGGLDFTSINQRAPWIRAALGLCFGCAAAGSVAHWLIWRDLRRLVADTTTLAMVGLGLLLAHIAAYGAPLGFPLPGPYLLFFPFLGTVFTVVHGALGAAGQLLLLARAARAAQRGAA